MTLVVVLATIVDDLYSVFELQFFLLSLKYYMKPFLVLDSCSVIAKRQLYIGRKTANCMAADNGTYVK